MAAYVSLFWITWVKNVPRWITKQLQKKQQMEKHWHASPAFYQLFMNSVACENSCCTEGKQTEKNVNICVCPGLFVKPPAQTNHLTGCKQKCDHQLAHSTTSFLPFPKNWWYPISRKKEMKKSKLLIVLIYSKCERGRANTWFPLGWPRAPEGRVASIIRRTAEGWEPGLPREND